MKNIIWAILILAIAIGFLAESRYKLVVNSPIVARMDRITGEVWIASGGVWRMIQCEPQEHAAGLAGTVSTKEGAKAK